MIEEKLKYGMVGGSEGSFIGGVHRKAIGLTEKAELVSGCFGTDWKNNVFSGLKYGVKENRIYHNFQEMAAAESARADQLDFVVVATPNKFHYPIAKEFLSHGFHVVCEKPLCFEPDEAYDLKRIAQDKGLIVCVSYTYVGYPMVKQMKRMIENGEIGEITAVMAEFSQDWMAKILDSPPSGLSFWRNDPEINGKAGCVGDIGSHIECLVSYVTNLKIESLCANLRKVYKTANLDTDGEIMVKFHNGASGLYWCSQIAYGHSNDIKLRVFGTKGALEWNHENAEKLKIALKDKPVSVLERGREYLDGQVRQYRLLPSGHPEGFFEAFANIYMAFTDVIIKKKSGTAVSPGDMDFADLDMGLSGVQFINACVGSSQGNHRWVKPGKNQ